MSHPPSSVAPVSPVPAIGVELPLAVFDDVSWMRVEQRFTVYSSFVRSAVGFSDIVAVVRFCSKRCAPPLVHIVWSFSHSPSKWKHLGCMPLKPFVLAGD